MRIQSIPVLPSAGLFATAMVVGCHARAATRHASTPVQSHAIPSPSGSKLTIRYEGIGSIRLGMTVGEIPKAMPGVHLERSEDGDGVAFLDLIQGKDALMSTWVGDEDDGTPLTRADRTVQAIETFSPLPTTPDGVHVGMRLQDVEKIWGPVTKIEYTEIESREFVTFQRSPKWLIIRTYGGIYAEKDRTKPTRKFEPDAAIHSLAITTLRR